MVEKSSVAAKFSWAVCLLLVVVLCGCVLWLSPGPTQSAYADALVTVTPDNPESIGSTPAAAIVDIAAGDTHPLDSALRIAREALSKFRAEVQDYTGTLVKRERIGGSLGGEMKMEFKIRARQWEGDKLVRPLHVYLKVLDPWLARGREIIWVEQANEGKLVAHEGGLKNLVRVSLAPTDNLAMMGNKYPITEIGLAKLIEKLIEKGERDKQVGPCEVKISNGFEVGGRPCQKIEVIHPLPDPRFDFHVAQIFIDTERMIPLRYAAYLWPEQPGGPPPLEEEYTYVDVRLNVGLTDNDFDPENSAYNFP
ncbi:MAG: DUF1571 domain-containing protein [Pirellulaceae bacterium]|nr:DUF1571 domain-containing protein [Pirellulaceae bacterium]